MGSHHPCTEVQTSLGGPFANRWPERNTDMVSLVQINRNMWWWTSVCNNWYHRTRLCKCFCGKGYLLLKQMLLYFSLVCMQTVQCKHYLCYKCLLIEKKVYFYTCTFVNSFMGKELLLSVATFTFLPWGTTDFLVHRKRTEVNSYKNFWITILPPKKCSMSFYTAVNAAEAPTSARMTIHRVGAACSMPRGEASELSSSVRVLVRAWSLSGLALRHW